MGLRSGGVTAITEEAIRQLAGFRAREGPVVSCYLDVDGRRYRRTQDVELALERLLRAARDQEGGAAASADLERIQGYVRDGFDRSHTRGLAIFSCRASGLFEVVPLPVPVVSRVVVNNTPALGQLEAVVQELERFGVLLVDKQRARMFVFQLGELVDHSELFEAKPRGYDSIGEQDLVGYDKAMHHVEELVLQHLRHAAAVAFEVFQQHGFDRLTIGAPDELHPTIEGLLHPYLRARACERIDVPVTANVEEIRKAAIAVESQVERGRERELIQRLRDAVGRGARGVAGLDETLHALAERRVDVLFVSHGYQETGWRCESCGYLRRKGPRCPVDGSQMVRVDDVVEEAVDAALNQSCRVEVCADNADLDVLGRIGALLRF
jgi:peptide chain release factor subunit 1